MSDHIFNTTILKKPLQADLEDGHCTLCIDKNINGDHILIMG